MCMHVSIVIRDSYANFIQLLTQPKKLGAAEKYVLALGSVNKLKERLELLQLGTMYEDSCDAIRYVNLLE